MSDEQIRDIDAKEGGKSLGFGQIVTLLGLALFVIFIFQNSQTSNIDILGWTINLPVWLVGVIVFLLGALVGYYSKTKKVKAQRKALK